jgi:hypothetical protein
MPVDIRFTAGLKVCISLLFIKRKSDQDHLATARECTNNNQASGVFLSVWGVIPLKIKGLHTGVSVITSPTKDYPAKLLDNIRQTIKKRCVWGTEHACIF